MGGAADALRDAGIAVGDVIGGKYRVDAALGRGGMGLVVAATHLDLEEKVALKLIRNADVRAVARFVREARATVRIKSEHAVRVMDVGVLDDGAPFLVMELLEGVDLSHKIGSDGPPAIEVAVGWVLEAIEALAQAHALGIVHRDLKLANLFLSRRPDGSECVKILDFGISRLIGPAKGDEPSLTETEAVLGSPTYMGPELWVNAKNAEPASDIWSLGVILYLLLSGKRPFPAGSIAEQCQAILNDEPVPLTDLRPELPPMLWSIVSRCLRKKPAERWLDVAVLADALVAFGPPRCVVHAERAAGVLAKSKGARTEEPPDPTTAETRPVAAAKPRAATRALWLAGVAALLVAAAVIGARAIGDPAAPASSASVVPIEPEAATVTTTAAPRPASTAPPVASVPPTRERAPLPTAALPSARRTPAPKAAGDDLAGPGELDP